MRELREDQAEKLEEMRCAVGAGHKRICMQAPTGFGKTVLYPINHGMVIKRTLAEKHPWVILNLMKAFDKANAIANRQRMDHVTDHLAVGLIPGAAKAALAHPVIEHGIKANRKILETCADYSLEQGLTPRRMKLEEIFAPSTLAQ